MDATYYLTYSAEKKCFDWLSCTTALWTRDICKKVLSMRFRRRQCDYFGKKVMALYVNFFLEIMKE